MSAWQSHVSQASAGFRLQGPRHGPAQRTLELGDVPPGGLCGAEANDTARVTRGPGACNHHVAPYLDFFLSLQWWRDHFICCPSPRLFLDTRKPVVRKTSLCW